MKHLYNLNNNASLLSRNPNLLSSDNPEKQTKKNSDFDLLFALSIIDSESDEEPSEALIDYLLNYSRSLDVQRLNNNNVCVFNKN